MEHPITPPTKLIREWNEEAATAPMADQRYIAIQAARWGFRQCIAAALRAAADQVVPEENVDEADYDCLQAKWVDQGKQEARAQILAIVTELENLQ